MMIGSVTVSAGDYGYWPGGCPSCEETGAATGADTGETPPEESPAASTSGQTMQQSSGSPVEGEPLTPEEQKQVAQLQQRDRDVRAHEAAHVAAGGGYVRGGASFSYQTGPDGKRYAVGGEVGIDTSSVKDNPEATIIKMQTVRRAALAPANPSGQDRSVAAAASTREAQARQDLREEQSAESKAGKEPKKVTIQGGYNSAGKAETVGEDSKGIKEAPAGLIVDLRI